MFTLSLPERDDRTKVWRYNLSLLSDFLLLQEIQSCMALFFKENSTFDVSPVTIWEAHKYVLRGKLIALAAAHKKRKQKIINDL